MSTLPRPAVRKCEIARRLGGKWCTDGAAYGVQPRAHAMLDAGACAYTVFRVVKCAAVPRVTYHILLVYAVAKKTSPGLRAGPESLLRPQVCAKGNVADVP